MGRGSAERRRYSHFNFLNHAYHNDDAFCGYTQSCGWHRLASNIVYLMINPFSAPVPAKSHINLLSV